MSSFRVTPTFATVFRLARERAPKRVQEQNPAPNWYQSWFSRADIEQKAAIIRRFGDSYERKSAIDSLKKSLENQRRAVQLGLDRASMLEKAIETMELTPEQIQEKRKEEKKDTLVLLDEISS